MEAYIVRGQILCWGRLTENRSWVCHILQELLNSEDEARTSQWVNNVSSLTKGRDQGGFKFLQILQIVESSLLMGSSRKKGCPINFMSSQTVWLPGCKQTVLIMWELREYLLFSWAFLAGETMSIRLDVSESPAAAVWLRVVEQCEWRAEEKRSVLEIVDCLTCNHREALRCRSRKSSCTGEGWKEGARWMAVLSQCGTGN